VEQPFFTGHYQQTLDDKWRLLVPANVRKRIKPELHGEGFYLVITPERRLWMYPDRYFQWLHTRGVEPDAIPQRDLVNFDRLNLGLAVEVEPDKTGRIVISEGSRTRVKLGKDVTVVGNRDHLEIWDTAVWISESEKLMDRGEDVAERARMARSGEPVRLRTQTVTGMEGQF
jgi:MraZ protein